MGGEKKLQNIIDSAFDFTDWNIKLISNDFYFKFLPPLTYMGGSDWSMLTTYYNKNDFYIMIKKTTENMWIKANVVVLIIVVHTCSVGCVELGGE